MQDESGFRDFVQGGAQRHLRTAYLLTGNAHDAEDLLQTALARLMGVWDRVSVSGEPDGYLRKVLVNTQASRWQRRWRGEVATGRLPEGMHDPFPQAEERDHLRWALQDLSRGERAVVVLRHIEDLSEAEVARLLGCSIGTVKSQAARGLSKLRRALAPTPVREATS